MGFNGVSGSPGNQESNFQIIESSSEAAPASQVSAQVNIDSSASSEASVSAEYTTQAGDPILPHPVEEQDLTPSIGVLTSTELEEANLDLHYTTVIHTLINTKGLPPEEAGQIRFAIDNPDDPNISNPIRQKAQDILKEAREQMVREGAVPADWQPPKADGTTFAMLYGKVADEVLEQAIEDLEQEITPQQKMNLKFALYYPDKASPETLTMLENLGIKGKIATFFANRPDNYTLPTDWQPNTSFYDSQMQDIGEANFSRVVLSYAAKHNLSADDQIQLNTKYYNSAAVLSPELQKVFEQLTGRVAKSMPAGWTSAPDQEFFQGKVSAELRYENYVAVQAYARSHSLNASQAALLSKAMADPTDPSVPQDLREAAAGILEQTRQAMIAKYQLPEGWQPVGEPLPADNPATQYRLNALQNLDELEAGFSVVLKQVPDSPEKVLIMDALKAISDAIKGLRESIYEMESLEALASKDITLARKESAIYKAEKNYEQMEKMRKEQEKIEKAKKKGKLISNLVLAVTVVAAVVAVAATILSFGTLGPVAVACMLALIAVSTTDSGLQAAGVNFSIMGSAFNAAAKAGAATFEAMGLPPEAGKVLFKVAFIAILCVLAVAAGGGGVAASMVGSQLFASSGITKEVAVDCGADEQTAMYIDIAVTSAVAIASMYYAASATSTVTRAQLARRLEAQAAECAGELARGTANSVERVMLKMSEALYRLQAALVRKPDTALSILNTVNAATELTSSGLGVWNGYQNYEIENMHARVAKDKASFDASQSKIADQIEALKQAVKKLEDLLNQFISMLAGVGKAQTKVWSDNQTQYPA